MRAYLADNAGELTLIDTLFDTDAHDVLAAIRNLGKTPHDLKRIAITHAHRSHLGGLARLKRESGATVHAHLWEADIIAGDRRAQAVSILPHQSLKLIPFQLGLWLDFPKHHPCPIDEQLADGDTLGPFEVLYAPGHSPGHLAFHWPERQFLVVGDAIATWPNLCPGWRVFNLNRRQHHDTLQRFASLEASIVGVGHGDAITDSAAEKVQELASRPVP